MVQDKPSGVSALDEHRKRAAERKGRQSIEVMPAQEGPSPRPEKTAAGPSHKSKKRPRKSGNIATTTRSPGSMPTPPPPRREVVAAGGSSPRRAGGASGSSDAGGRPSALDLLGGGLQFTRRVCVALPDETRESIRVVFPTDLMRSSLELLCRSVVLF